MSIENTRHCLFITRGRTNDLLSVQNRTAAIVFQKFSIFAHKHAADYVNQISESDKRRRTTYLLQRGLDDWYLKDLFGAFVKDCHSSIMLLHWLSLLCMVLSAYCKPVCRHPLFPIRGLLAKQYPQPMAVQFLY